MNSRISVILLALEGLWKTGSGILQSTSTPNVGTLRGEYEDFTPLKKPQSHITPSDPALSPFQTGTKNPHMAEHGHRATRLRHVRRRRRRLPMCSRPWSRDWSEPARGEARWTATRWPKTRWSSAFPSRRRRWSSDRKSHTSAWKWSSSGCRSPRRRRQREPARGWRGMELLSGERRSRRCRGRWPGARLGWAGPRHLRHGQENQSCRGKLRQSCHQRWSTHERGIVAWRTQSVCAGG